MKITIRFWMQVILFALSSVFLTNCKEDLTIPKVSTNKVTEVTNTTATSGGVISSDGGASVTARGVCWSTNQTPTIADKKTTDGTGAGNFTSTITGLKANTTYYVRAYATNSAGTAYGNVSSFTTFYGSFTDSRDGNVYMTIKIDNEVWMAENLRYLPNVVGPKTSSKTTPYYYVYGYYGTNVSEAKTTPNYSNYGVLYNWIAACSSCPEGWHLPSDEELTDLTNYLGGLDIAGGKLKETGTTHWKSPNEGATNESRFTALPGGIRYYQLEFYSIGLDCSLWSSTEIDTLTAWFRHMSSESGNVYRHNYFKENGLSVRCGKN